MAFLTDDGKPIDFPFVDLLVAKADAALLAEAYDYAQFAPDSQGNIQLPATVRAALGRVLSSIALHDPATAKRRADWASMPTP